MQNNNLLKNWQKAEDKKIIFFGSVIVLALVGLLYALIMGTGISIRWDVLSELKSIPLSLDFIQNNQVKLNINSNVYIIQETFLASPLNIPVFVYFVCGFLVLLGVNLFLPAITQLSRYWFIGGILIMAFLLSSAHVEIVFKSVKQYYFLVFFGLLAVVAYYFHSFASDTAFWKKALVFLVLITLGLVYLMVESKINEPFVGLFSYAYLSFLVITAGFVLMIAHEIPAILVWVVSKNGSKKENYLLPYIVLSVFYLINVLLIYLDKANYLNLALYSINPVFLLIISMLAGFWGMKDFCEQTIFFSFKHTVFWIYVSFSLICISTIGFAYASGNDSLTDAIEDFLSYAFLSSGLTFFVYVIVNFSQVLKNGLQAYKVIYRPKFLEFLLFRLATIVLVVVLITIKNYNNFFQAKAGYYNVLADFYDRNKEMDVAEAFYKESLHQDIRNHHANYALASMAMKLGDKENAIFFLKNVVENKPSPWAYIGLSKAYQEKDMFFESFFVLKEGALKFPHNQELLNNLAWGYDRLNVKDSTMFYLQKAKENCQNCALAESNLLAYQIKISKNDDLSQYLLKLKKYSNMSLIANLTAAKKILNQPIEENIELSKDSILNVSQFASLYNQGTNLKYTGNIKSDGVRKILQKNQNNQFYDDLVYVTAQRNYLKENKIEGIKQMTTLASTANQNNQMYYQNAAIWFLQQNIYEEALQYLTLAGDTLSAQTLRSLNYQSSLLQNQTEEWKSVRGKLNSKKEVEMIYRNYPLNPLVLKEIVAFYNRNGQSEKAYQLIFAATEIHSSSVEIWKLYVLQSIQIGMKEYAEEGLAKLKKIQTNADYQAFLSTYQAQKALMEKSKNTF